MNIDPRLPRGGAAVASIATGPAPGAVDAVEWAITNGDYCTIVTPTGCGGSWLDRVALTRWTGDVYRSEGWFIYLRDRESGALWSIGLAPCIAEAGWAGASWRPRVITLEREAHEVHAELEIAVADDAPLELRRITLRNLSPRARRIDVTSFMEVVLNDPDADAAHPAFSKLFVQTAHDALGEALIATRRPRNRGERWPVMACALHGAGELEIETDRARFLKRGGAVGRPAALQGSARLVGAIGNVLDPIFALRRGLTLEPHGSARFTAALAAGRDSGAALALVERARSASFVEGQFPPGEAGSTVFVQGGKLDGAEINGRHKEKAGPSRSHASSAGSRRIPSQTRGHGGEPLLAFNGYGGFSPDGREYVIRIPWDAKAGHRLPPRPWTNVIANEEFGFIVSERGAGPTWSRNSREHRLTPWSNDPVLDPHGEALYVRDQETGAFWSVFPGPAPATADYEVRHGFGFTGCRHSSHDLDHDVTLFVPRRDPVKIALLRLDNRSGRARRLSVFGWQQIVLGHTPRATGAIETEADPAARALFARVPGAEEFHGVAFATSFASRPSGFHWSSSAHSFLGRGGAGAPRAMTRDALPEDLPAAGETPCFAEQLVLEVGPGESVAVAVLLGEGDDEAHARRLLARYGTIASLEGALAEVRAFWNDTVSRIRIETPAPELDLMVNGWLPYQTLVCRIWGRSAFHQSGGAFGFRDQLQDAGAFTLTRPDLVRDQILLHAAHQFEEGDVLHWWHPPRSKGIRTRFADDLLWLPWVAAAYVEASGDEAVFAESVRFIGGPPLARGEDESFMVPIDSGARADLYEHCCRAIDRSLATGAHGLPLFGSGDWNDGMNRVGREGRGESVWMGFFLFGVLGRFAPWCERRGDRERAERYGEHRERLRSALEGEAWDGAWYRRGWYDDGTVLGSRYSDECRIDGLVQAWAVISGAGSRERCEAALDSVERLLVSEDQGLVRLLAPPFDRTPHDPGYIKGYVPGVRENGGQYTHAALWVVKALAELGRHETAARLLEMLSPVRHARDPEHAAVYEAEPYVVAADVYGEPPHVRRGGWTWYTGSAGWMYRVAVETVFGLGVEGGKTLVLRPRVPAEWPGCSLTYRLPDGRTTYEIAIRNPTGEPGRAVAATLDGTALSVQDGTVTAPLVADGATHVMAVTLGPPDPREVETA